MTRKPLIKSDALPYHVVNRCNNREWFKLPMPTVWEVTCSELYRISITYDARVHGFVLMSNHYHLLVSTPTTDLGIVMREFGRSVTGTFNRLSGRTGHLFNGPYKPTLIQSPGHYANALKYIYRNPVRAGITEKVEEYPYSTLHGILGQSHLPVPLHQPLPEKSGVSLLPDDLGCLVDWFNQPFPKESQLAMDRALRRKVFTLPRDQKTAK